MSEPSIDPEMQKLLDAARAVGPKQLKTETLDVSTHSPMMVQRLRERVARKPVLFSNFPSCTASPEDPHRNSCDCER